MALAAPKQTTLPEIGERYLDTVIQEEGLSYTQGKQFFRGRVMDVRGLDHDVGTNFRLLTEYRKNLPSSDDSSLSKDDYRWLGQMYTHVDALHSHISDLSTRAKSGKRNYPNGVTRSEKGFVDSYNKLRSELGILQSLEHYARDFDKACIQGIRANMDSLLSKIEDRARPEERYESLYVMMTSISDKYRDHLAKKGIDLVMIAPEEDVRVSSSFRGVIENLMENSMKHMRSYGPKRIELSFRQNGDHYVGSVVDTGVGIDEKDRYRIFGVGNSDGNAAYGKGQGLGLPMAKQTVEGYGGTLQVNSQLNRGSNFSFTIPLRSRGVQQYKNQARQVSA